MDAPIACTLSRAEFHQRRQAIMDAFHKMQVSVSELPDGYAFIFPATSEALMQITQLVDLERQCCHFLRFRIVVEAAQASMRLNNWARRSEEGDCGVLSADLWFRSRN
jgi:hypothetical protein